MKKHLVAATAVALLAACASEGGGTLPGTQTADSSTSLATKHRVKAVIRIKIPKRKHHRDGVGEKFLSPSTEGMTISFVAPTSLSETIGLTPSSPNCSASASGTVCTEILGLAPCPSTANCYRGSIATYDEVTCVLSACTVPPGAHQLSADQDVAFSIAAEKETAIPLTLGGIPASVALVPLPPSTLSGSSSSGFTISKCVTAIQSVNVVGLDADGNQIIGPGAPRPSLSSADTVHLAVVRPRPASPDTFELVPPSTLEPATLPNPGSVVQLTAGVRPLPRSGAPAMSLRIDVTFSHDLCGVITETSIPTPGSAPRNITAGPDGALWFTENGGNKIGRITTGGMITETSIPTAFSAPVGITAGPDGALWFTESCGNKIGRITTGATITETSIPTLASGPTDITAGPDGALWFTQFDTGQIGRITTGKTITEARPPTTGSNPQGITSGPDGALWFTENFTDKIGRSTTSAKITETLVPTSASEPYGITSGPDGALWFTECNSNKIGRITTGGMITETATPTSLSTPLGITTGPDGALWFAESTVNQIGRITTDGVITEIAIPTLLSVPYGITSGPDGALWFTEAAAGKIGRLQ